MGLISKGIKYGTVALVARHQAKTSAETQNQAQQQQIIQEANSLLAEQAAQHEAEQQALVVKANEIIAQQQTEHDQALKAEQESRQQHNQPHPIYPQQQMLPAPPTPCAQPMAGTRYVNGYPHQAWCSLQCSNSCNPTAVACLPQVYHGGPSPYNSPYASSAPTPVPATPAPYHQSSPYSQPQPYQAPVPAQPSTAQPYSAYQ